MCSITGDENVPERPTLRDHVQDLIGQINSLPEDDPSEACPEGTSGVQFMLVFQYDTGPRQLAWGYPFGCDLLVVNQTERKGADKVFDQFVRWLRSAR